MVSDRITTALAFAIIGLALIATALHGAGEDLIADDKLNQAWKKGKYSNQIIFERDAAPELALVLNKAAFAKTSVELLIEGGPGRLTVFSGDHQFEISLTESGRHQLYLTSNPRKPAISFNRQRLVLAEPAWRALVQDPTAKQFTLLMSDNKRLSITFRIRGTRLNLKLPGNGGDSGTASTEPAPRPTPIGQPKPQPAASQEEGMDAARLRRLRSSVFFLHVQTDHKQIKRRVPAFLISRSGFALTSYEPLLRAQSVTAVLGPTLRPIEVKLWKVAPEAGLALVKMDQASLAAAGTFEPFTFAEAKDMPEKDQPLWALGPLATGSGGAMKVKFIEGKERSELSGIRFKTLDQFPGSSRWWQVDRPFSADVAGGPPGTIGSR